jgi:hypothetical protein
MTEPLEPGSERIRDLPTYMNGRSKFYVALIGLLWTALASSVSWGLAQRENENSLASHVLNGHPLDSEVARRLGNLERGLIRIEDFLIDRNE